VSLLENAAKHIPVAAEGNFTRIPLKKKANFSQKIQ
jgi:hypothetical protein